MLKKIKEIIFKIFFSYICKNIQYHEKHNHKFNSRAIPDFEFLLRYRALINFGESNIIQ